MWIRPDLDPRHSYRLTGLDKNWESGFQIPSKYLISYDNMLRDHENVLREQVNVLREQENVLREP